MQKNIPIDSKGYGKIPKVVTRDSSIPLASKAIYAYLCAYAGNGSTAYPKRDKIVRDLKMNKDTLLKHLDTLLEKGFISKVRTTTGNLYIIIQDIGSFDNTDEPFDISEDSDYLEMESIWSKGFGTIPKIAMLDRRLDFKSKAIYAYFCSFGGSGKTAFPRTSTILRELDISENTYYKYYKALLELGYLSTKQIRKKGRFTVCIYKIHSSISVENSAYQEEQTPMSEKLRDDKSAISKANSLKYNGNIEGMSEKLRDGDDCGKSCGKPVEFLLPTSEKLMSDKLMSDNMGHDVFGHGDINNSPIINSSSISKQALDNHQCTDDNKSTAFQSNESWAYFAIDPCRLKQDVMVAYQFQKLLGRINEKEEQEFIGKSEELVKLLPTHVAKLLESCSDSEALKAKLLESLDNGEFQTFFERLLDHILEMRSVEEYLKKALANFFKGL